MVPHVEKSVIHSWRISRLRLLIGEGAVGYNQGKFRTTGGNNAAVDDTNF